MTTQATITGPCINKMLFDQAGVEAPADDVGWDSWAAAAKQVAEATQTQFPMTMDRFGHRIAGPAISMGANIFADDGTPAPVDEGFSNMIEKFTWNQDGTMAIDVWGAQGYAGDRAMFNPTVTRVTQAVVGELSVEDALARITADVEEAVAEAAKSFFWERGPWTACPAASFRRCSQQPWG